MSGYHTNSDRATTHPMTLIVPPSQRTPGIAKAAINAQNAGSDQSLIFTPSNGPNGSMLNRPRMRFAVSQYVIPKYTMAGKEIPDEESIGALVVPTATSRAAPNGIPIKNKPRLTKGPAAAIWPFCLL